MVRGDLVAMCVVKWSLAWWWSGRKTSCLGRRRYGNLQQSGPMLIG
jgi:hypothetical protein